MTTMNVCLHPSLHVIFQIARTSYVKEQNKAIKGIWHLNFLAPFEVLQEEEYQGQQDQTV